MSENIANLLSFLLVFTLFFGSEAISYTQTSKEFHFI